MGKYTNYLYPYIEHQYNLLQIMHDRQLQHVIIRDGLGRIDDRRDLCSHHFCHLLFERNL